MASTTAPSGEGLGDSTETQGRFRTSQRLREGKRGSAAIPHYLSWLCGFNGLPLSRGDLRLAHDLEQTPVASLVIAALAALAIAQQVTAGTGLEFVKGSAENVVKIVAPDT